MRAGQQGGEAVWERGRGPQRSRSAAQRSRAVGACSRTLVAPQDAAQPVVSQKGLGDVRPKAHACSEWMGAAKWGLQAL